FLELIGKRFACDHDLVKAEIVIGHCGEDLVGLARLPNFGRAELPDVDVGKLVEVKLEALDSLVCKAEALARSGRGRNGNLRAQYGIGDRLVGNHESHPARFQDAIIHSSHTNPSTKYDIGRLGQEGPQKGKVRRGYQIIILEQSWYVVLPQGRPVMQVAGGELCEVVDKAVTMVFPFFGKDKAHEHGDTSPEGLARNQFDLLLQDACDRGFRLGEWRRDRTKNLGRRVTGFQCLSRARALNDDCYGQ